MKAWSLRLLGFSVQVKGFSAAQGLGFLRYREFCRNFAVEGSLLSGNKETHDCCPWLPLRSVPGGSRGLANILLVLGALMSFRPHWRHS